MFCVQCGAETQHLVESQCGSCWLKRNRAALVPREIDVVVCYQCNSLLRGKTWLPPAPEREPVLVDEVKRRVWTHKLLEEKVVEPVLEVETESNVRCDVQVQGRIAGVPHEEILETRLRVKVNVCQACSRQAGGYFASVIQLRATDRDPTLAESRQAHGLLMDLLDAAWKRGNRQAFLARDEEVKGGSDYYLGDIEVGRQVARALAEEFSTRHAEAAKLMGEKEGKPVHRVTFLVRIPPYKRDDVLVTDKGPMLVTSVSPRSVGVIRLTDGVQATLPKEQAERAKVLVGGEHVKEVLIVSVVKDEALILDQQTNKTHEVRLPSAFQYAVGRATLHAVEVDEQFYVVPTRADR